MESWHGHGSMRVGRGLCAGVTTSSQSAAPVFQVFSSVTEMWLREAGLDCFLRRVMCHSEIGHRQADFRQVHEAVVRGEKRMYATAGRFARGNTNIRVGIDVVSP